jgi:hypothetical protein
MALAGGVPAGTRSKQLVNRLGNLLCHHGEQQLGLNPHENIKTEIWARALIEGFSSAHCSSTLKKEARLHYRTGHLL